MSMQDKKPTHRGEISSVKAQMPHLLNLSEMTAIKNIAVPEFNRISGVYCVTGIREETHSNGETVKVLRLSDASGDVDGYIWPEDNLEAGAPSSSGPYRVDGTVTYKGNIPVVSIAQIYKADAWGLTTLYWFPKLWIADDCLRQLIRLLALFNKIRSPLIRGFLNSVLSDPRIHQAPMFGVLGEDPTSDFSSHLFDHNLETAEHALQAVGPNTWPQDRDLMIVASLLFDVGVYAGSDSAKNAYWAKRQNSRGRSLEILRPHLSQLNEFWPEAATALVEILLLYPGEAGLLPEYIPPQVVTDAHQWSLRRRQFMDAQSSRNLLVA